MRDEETNSLWDHITGECFEGALAGKRMEFWHAGLTNVAAELAKSPDTLLLASNHNGLLSKIMTGALSRVTGSDSAIEREGTILPPHFRHSMRQKIDPRLPEGEQGLGVIGENDQGKFYPMRALPKGGAVDDVWQGRRLRIERNGLDGVPFARWLDDEGAPMQLLSRWYGFSFTYPDCPIFEPT